MATTLLGGHNFHSSRPAKILAWVKIYASGGTPTIVDSYNVDSITDRSVGRYTVVFENALDSSDYAVLLDGLNTGNSDGAWNSVDGFSGATGTGTASCMINSYNTGGSNQDQYWIYVTFIGRR